MELVLNNNESLVNINEAISDINKATIEIVETLQYGIALGNGRDVGL
jgi:hypothetical protein